MNRLWTSVIVAALVAGATSTSPARDVAGAACDPSPPGLVSSWQAEGDYTDCNGLNHGTQVGSVPFAPGKIGQAFSFPSPNPGNYVDLGNPASLKFTNALTIAAWIYPTQAPDPGNLRAILVKWAQRFDPPESLEDSYGLWTENGSGGTLRIFGAINQQRLGGPALEPHVDGGSVPLNAWSHVAMTFYTHATDVNLKVYVNCAVVASLAAGDHPIIPSDKRVLIGREDSPNTRPWAGLIDQVRVYDRALSELEISQLARSGDPDICGHYAFTFACPPDTVLEAKAAAHRLFTITNTGTLADSYEYGVTDDSGWIPPLSGTTGPVAPGDTYTIKVAVTGDTDCSPSTDLLTFAVRSTADLRPPQTCTTRITCAPASVTKTLESDNNPAMCGSKVTLTNRLSQADATGQVTFYEGSTVLGAVPVSSGVATLSIATLAPGTHTIIASYSGDGGHLPANSNEIEQVVNAISTTTTLTGDPNPNACGQKVTFTATVDPPSATGNVVLAGDATGSAPLIDGVATFSLVLGTGTHSFTAHYAGDACHAPSSSGKLAQLTAPAPITTTLESTPNPSQCPQKVTLTATVSPHSASGEVNFLDGGAPIGSATLVGGVAVLSLPDPPMGTHVYTAIYKGDACHAGSPSNPATHVHDCPTPTLLSMFRAEATSGAIELRWQFSDPAAFEVSIERSTGESGSWSAIAVERRDADGFAIAVDRSIEPGRTYWYRLIAASDTGDPLRFGPVAVTAGRSIDRFELTSVWPNPGARNIRVDFTAARDARIRLSVLDVQGREVVVLAQGAYGPGRYQAIWTGETARGPAPMGLYFVRYQHPGKVELSRLVLAR